MHEEIIIAGFGGQGVLFAGQLLAYAGMNEGRHVTWIPSYGPEMRGGTANCTTIISDEEIGAPVVRRPSTAIVLNPPSMDKYAPLVKPHGLLIVDSFLFAQQSGRTDIREIAIPAKDIAAEAGLAKAANVVAIGALIAATGIVQFETVVELLTLKFGQRSQEILAANKRALRLGADYVLKLPA